MQHYQTTVRLGDLKPYKGKRTTDISVALFNLSGAVTRWDITEEEVTQAIKEHGVYKLTTEDGRKCTIKPVK